MILDIVNYRTREIAAQLIEAALNLIDVPERIVKGLLNSYIWMASEKDEEGRNIKYFGQPYWSAEAMLTYKNGLQNGKAKHVLTKNFRHDHAVPRKVLLSKIGESGKNAAEVLSILNIYLHSVVVTKDEDTLLKEKGLNATMPPGLIDDASERYVFGRYQNAGIEVVSGVGF